MENLHAMEKRGILKGIPKTARGIATLEKLCATARRLFSEKSYYSASVSEIALEAGTSIGTFYIYFHDKLGLYRFIVLQCGRRIRRAIAGRIAALGITDQRTATREGVKTFLDVCRDDPSIFSLVWQALFVAPDIFRDYYTEFSARYVRHLSEGVQDGQVRSLDLELVSYVLMGACNFIALRYAVFQADSTDDERYEVADRVVNLLDKGLFPAQQDVQTKKDRFADPS